VVQNIVAESISNSRELSSLVAANELLKFKPKKSKLVVAKSDATEDKLANRDVKEKIGDKAVQQRPIVMTSLPHTKRKSNIRAQQDVDRFPPLADMGVDDGFDLPSLHRNPSRLRLLLGRRNDLRQRVLDLKSQDGHVGRRINLPRDSRQRSKVATHEGNRHGVLEGLTIEGKPRWPQDVEILGARNNDEHRHSRMIDPRRGKQEVIVYY